MPATRTAAWPRRSASRKPRSVSELLGRSSGMRDRPRGLPQGRAPTPHTVCSLVERPLQRLACLPSAFLTASFALPRSRRRPPPNGLANGDRSLPSDVAPRKTKHISLVVCSPKVTILGGLLGLLGFFTLLS